MQRRWREHEFGYELQAFMLQGRTLLYSRSTSLQPPLCHLTRRCNPALNAHLRDGAWQVEATAKCVIRQRLLHAERAHRQRAELRRSGVCIPTRGSAARACAAPMPLLKGLRPSSCGVYSALVPTLRPDMSEQSSAYGAVLIASSSWHMQQSQTHDDCTCEY